MQLELGIAAAAPAPAPAPAAGPRVLALAFPDLPLQRVLRARAARPEPAGPRRPLAVERGGRVVACDAEARARGVQPGDTPVQARAACAELELVPADEAEDRAALEGAAEALLALAPAVEVGRDGLWLDASGAHLMGSAGSAGDAGDPEARLARGAVDLCAELGLRCRGAVATGRGPARALARHGAAGAGGVVPPVGPGAAAAALARLPLAALELSPPFAARLGALGLREVGDLARLPPETLGQRFGAEGLAAWRLAWGDDPTPLSPYVPRRLPEERLELEAPVESAEPLLFALKRLCDRLAARLGGRGLGATRLTLALRLDPRGEERLALALAAPTSAAARWLLVLRERVGALRLPAAVVAVALAVAEAAPAAREQLALGDRPQQLEALDAVLARLGARLGEQALFAAAPADRHRPEAAYAPGAFGRRGRDRRGAEAAGARPERRARKGRGGRARPGDARPDEPAASDLPPASALARPTRLLPRPEPLVALGEGGRLAAVRLGARTLQVLALSPAERLAGEWWADPFDRDYHRARLEGLGDCWIFRDAGDGRLWLHGFFD